MVGPRGEVYVVPAPGPRIRIEFCTSHYRPKVKGGQRKVGRVVVGDLNKEDGGNLCEVKDRRIQSFHQVLGISREGW